MTDSLTGVRGTSHQLLTERCSRKPPGLPWGTMSAIGSPRTVNVTRSPVRNASTTRAVSLRRSLTPTSMCDSVGPGPAIATFAGRKLTMLWGGGKQYHR
ncbi:hypothetical protein BH24ACT11_BH24ACT11_00240 [soil metagenome]